MKPRRLKSTPHLNASETYLGIMVPSTQLHKRHQAAPSKEEERRGLLDTKHTDKDRPADPRARGSSGRRSPWTSGVHPGLAGHPLPPPFPPRPAFSFLHLSSSASSVRVVGGWRHVTVAQMRWSRAAVKQPGTVVKAQRLYQKALPRRRRAEPRPVWVAARGSLWLGGVVRSNSVEWWRLVLEQQARPG